MVADYSAQLAAQTAWWCLLCAAVPAALLAFSLWRRRVQLARARVVEEARARGSERLRAGFAVVYGRVDERDEDAVMVEIEQRPVQQQGEFDSWIEWREIRRRVTARPFYLVRPSGEQVRVEPGARVVFLDRPELTKPVHDKLRVRVARLSAREQVYVTGVIRLAQDPRAGGYRDMGERLVLFPPPLAPMRISTIPEEPKRRVRLHERWMIALAILIPLIQAPFAKYHLLRSFGETVSARITRLYEHTSDDDNEHKLTTHYLDAVWEMHLLSDEVPDEIAGQLHVGDTVPFLVLRGRPSVHALGVHAGLDLAPILFFAMMWPLFAIYGWTMRPPLELRRRLNER